MSRRLKIGVVATVVAGLVALGGAVAFSHPAGGRQAFMKRMASAWIDGALDSAQVSADQRVAVHAARDRAFAALEQHHQDHRARMDQVLAMFESDRLDPAQVEAFRAAREAERRQIGDAITQALLDVHGVLTPAQRRAVAEYVRTHAPHSHGG
jgi:Spy/CpxP family protein refolding chaperone